MHWCVHKGCFVLFFAKMQYFTRQQLLSWLQANVRWKLAWLLVDSLTKTVCHVLNELPKGKQINSVVGTLLFSSETRTLDV